jgi:NAD(P)-dependent dehydrogenase (short-subunit alcohol dehydrogenase family)
LTAGAAPDRIEALGATTLLSRPARPGEIAEIIAFLASPRACYVTGAVFAGDGGRTQAGGAGSRGVGCGILVE